MIRQATASLLVTLIVFSGLAGAHETRPAYLRIRQVDAERFETLWRVPARGVLRLAIYLEMPAHCSAGDALLTWNDGGTFVEEGRWRCPGGLVGGTVSISGLEGVLTDALARFERLDGTTQVARLGPSNNAFELTAAESRRQIVVTYLSLGIEHILLGIDHLLFVLALLLLVPNTRTLIWTVTAFTVAHSVTLAAATLGLANVPQRPVEAVIALSILFVAAEIVNWEQGRPGIGRRWPWLVAFVFGLLHGFGFAGALSEIGLPQHAIPLALLFFNLGVEAGQLLFIGAMLALWVAVRRLSWPEWAWRMPVYGIGALAAFWTIERIAGLAA